MIIKLEMSHNILEVNFRFQKIILINKTTFSELFNL